ncbi:hypothetical protein, partial [Microcoleus sp. MON2_D5]|uniref:hypothetical protein n=1 Tax=Microcoleus sp. MON2_D5 TaxID=2818833 RepID=UPI002FD36939
SSFFTVLLAFSFWRFFHIFAKVRCTLTDSHGTLEKNAERELGGDRTVAKNSGSPLPQLLS